MEKLERKDYKAIKHMNREIMEKYLNGIYQRGYSDGATAMARALTGRKSKTSWNPRPGKGILSTPSWRSMLRCAATVTGG